MRTRQRSTAVPWLDGVKLSCLPGYLLPFVLAWAFLPLAAHASHAQAHWRLALDFRFQGRTDAAIAEYVRGLEIEPEAVAARDQLAMLLLEEAGDVDGAISQLLTALNYDPSCSFCRLHLDQALSIRNSTAFEQIARGNRLYAEGKRERAAAAYRIAAYIDPGDAVARNSLAWTFYSLGRIKDGFAEVDIALKLKPDDPEYINTLACLYYENGDLDTAINTWRKAISKSNEPAAADLYGLALGMISRGDDEQAGRFFVLAVEADPKYRDLAYVKDRVGMSLKAVAYHDKLLSLAGDRLKK